MFRCVQNDISDEAGIYYDFDKGLSVLKLKKMIRLGMKMLLFHDSVVVLATQNTCNMLRAVLKIRRVLQQLTQ